MGGMPRCTGGTPRTWWVGRLKNPPRRRRGRKPKTTKSLLNHLNRTFVVWERGDLCNLPNKTDPAKKSWGREHLRAAKAAHHGCQVYEGKKKIKGRKTTMSFRPAGTFEKRAGTHQTSVGLRRQQRPSRRITH